MGGTQAEKSDAATRSRDWLRDYVHGLRSLGASRSLDPFPRIVDEERPELVWLVARFLLSGSCLLLLLLYLCPLALMLNSGVMECGLNQKNKKEFVWPMEDGTYIGFFLSLQLLYACVLVFTSRVCMS